MLLWFLIKYMVVDNRLHILLWWVYNHGISSMAWKHFVTSELWRQMVPLIDESWWIIIWNVKNADMCGLNAKRARSHVHFANSILRLKRKLEVSYKQKLARPNRRCERECIIHQQPSTIGKVLRLSRFLCCWCPRPDSLNTIEVPGIYGLFQIQVAGNGA